MGAQILNFKAQTQKRKFEKLCPQMQKRAFFQKFSPQMQKRKCPQIKKIFKAQILEQKKK